MAHITGGTELLNPHTLLKKAGIATSMQIADFGCGGQGQFVLTAAKTIGNGGTIYAVDIQKTVLEGIENKAKTQGLKNIKTIWTNLEIYKATKIEDGKLDIGLLINTLFQSKKHLEIIKECVRMIKLKGALMVIDWKNVPSAFGPATVDRVSQDAIKAIASQINLRLIEEFDAGHYHYGLLFKK